MKKIFSTTKAGFIFKSLSWSIMLYACVFCICNWQEISGKLGHEDNQPAVYTSTTSNISPVRISMDSLHKRILLVDGAIQQIRVFLKK